MSWKIVYTAQALHDLRSIFEYICYELCVPDIATNQSRKIMQCIRALENMPMRHRLYDDEPWHTMGIRFFPVDNFLVYYLPVEVNKVVNIVRIIYGGRDIKAVISEQQEFPK